MSKYWISTTGLTVMILNSCKILWPDYTSTCGHSITVASKDISGIKQTALEVM